MFGSDGKNVAAVIAIVGGLASGPAYAATFFATTVANSGTTVGGDPNQIDTQTSMMQPVAAGSSSESLYVAPGGSSTLSGSGSASASAQAGAVRGASFSGSSIGTSACCGSAGSSGASNAFYSDSFFLPLHTSLGQTPGTGTARVNLTGLLGGTGIGVGPFVNLTGSAAFRASITVNNTSYTLARTFSTDGLNPTYSGDPFGIYNLPIALNFGQVNFVQIGLETWASSSVGGIGTMSTSTYSDLSSTLAWAGLTDVSARGVAVTDYTAISADTGFNFRTGFYANSVPEPGTWALLILGFGAVGGAMRARTGTPRHPALA